MGPTLDEEAVMRVSTLTCLHGRFENCRLCGAYFGGDTAVRHCMMKRVRIGILPLPVNRHVSQICGECRTVLRKAGWKKCHSGSYMGSPILM